MNGLPPRIKAEVKFTTSSGISVPERERKAVHPDVEGTVGVIAVMSLYGNRELDGRWILVDAEKAFGRRKAKAISAQIAELARLAEQQRHLHPLRDTLSAHWPAFLQAYLEGATASRANLQSDLKRRHRSGTLGERVGTDRILDLDHLENVGLVVDAHGEGVAGGIFQDLFAYLLGFIGYATVVSNTIGVPDVAASGLRDGEPIGQPSFSRQEIERLAELCEKAGEAALALRLRKQGRGSADFRKLRI